VAVDPSWLSQVRHKNQKSVGLAGSADLHAAFQGQVTAAAAVASKAAAEREAAYLRAGILPPSAPVTSKTTNYILYGAMAVAGIAIAVAAYRRLKKKR